MTSETNTTHPYTYYISYSYPHGFGATSYSRTKPLTTWEQITALAADIGHRNGLSGIVIISYQLMTGPTA